jgi:hypothetical protein
MAKEVEDSTTDQVVDIYDIKPGDAINLNDEDKLLCLTSIREYDPQAVGIKSVIRSTDAMHLVDVLLDDGALWQLHQHPVGLIPTLKVLGSSHQNKPLTADIACAYHPDRNIPRPLDLSRASIPEVDCGVGYMQLDFNETILESDEYYAGPDGGWKKTGETAGHYWPSHGSVGGPYALMRRALPTVRKVAKP